jgi:F0F1-type ATP synthase membrane subunit b/b'
MPTADPRVPRGSSPLSSISDCPELHGESGTDKDWPISATAIAPPHEYAVISSLTQPCTDSSTGPTLRSVVLASLLLLSVPALAGAAEDGLQLVPDFRVLPVHFLVLLLLIYPIQNWLLRPLAEILEVRALRTTGAVSEADRQTSQSRDLALQIEQRLAKARQDAQAQRSATLADAEAKERELLERAREEAARTIETVRSDVAAEYGAARASIEPLARELAREAAERLLGRPL